MTRQRMNQASISSIPYAYSAICLKKKVKKTQVECARSNSKTSLIHIIFSSIKLSTHNLVGKTNLRKKVHKLTIYNLKHTTVTYRHKSLSKTSTSPGKTSVTHTSCLQSQSRKSNTARKFHHFSLGTNPQSTKWHILYI